MRRSLFGLIVVSAIAVSSAAQHHHEAAPLDATTELELGDISFPNSGAPAAQPSFLRGVLLLHSFEYSSAARAFAEARAIDPAFAMAYWGEAMTYNHPIWGEQDREAAHAVLNALAPTAAERRARAATDREKGYFDAIEALYGEGSKKERDAAYSAAMKSLAERHPDDLDARAFYSLSLLGLTGAERNTANYMRAAGVAEHVYEKNRRHPGALHYLIHAYDDPIHAPLGLRAARLYATVARGASHAQHMPSHIFFALGMWQEAIASNIDSMKTARDQGAGGYHPLHWLEHAYLQVGREDDAAALVKIVEADVTERPGMTTRTHLAMTRATWLVETRGRGPASMLERVDNDGIAAILPFAAHDFARGFAAVERKDLDAARGALGELRALMDAGRARISAVDVATRMQSVTANDITTAGVMATALEAAIAFASGAHDRGVALALEAANAEDALVFEYGPPVTVKPAWELAGELLLAAGRKDDAVDAFRRVLVRYPGRSLSVIGLQRSEAR